MPRNEYGQPDLRGVWNFSSDVPLQRPKDAPDKLLQTPEDIQKSNAAREKQLEQYTQQGVGAHNVFWLDYKSRPRIYARRCSFIRRTVACRSSSTA